ncbi:MAG: malate dehydrogenase [Bacteroidetes bacterium RIFOXYA12_FULL_40_10]|jgi:malate dehydrogenase|nr:MAG: malate dehydrogenase [Bacteroidetes bacterium RIFOXYA12_FULL_40_10]PKP07264.1 MAG: malate dehydrogenase [Bacteroidetes bacterium HGW-Bacteroidetes-5]HBG24926.1 malate dehydrogenase [Rikenellaceae bacterium]
MSKVTVVGAGNVGATCTNAIANMQFASELVLLDIKEGLAEGKAKDMMQTAKLYRYFTKVTGVTNDYAATANSDVVVITSGIPRKPGMTREELIETNAKIVSDVIDQSLKHSPNAILVIISNPMDTMTYLTFKKTSLPKNRIIGMGGILDGSRFTDYLSDALDVPSSDIEGMVIGGHGDTTMIPLARFASYKGIPVTELLSEEKLGKVIADTMVGGATLTRLLGTSAWYAPGAAAAVLVKAIILNEKRVYPCCVYLEGEYGQKDICIGVPVMIGNKGWEKVIEFKLNEEEKALFKRSADSVRATNNVLFEINLI